MNFICSLDNRRMNHLSPLLLYLCCPWKKNWMILRLLQRVTFMAFYRCHGGESRKSLPIIRFSLTLNVRGNKVMRSLQSSRAFLLLCWAKPHEKISPTAPGSASCRHTRFLCEGPLSGVLPWNLVSNSALISLCCAISSWWFGSESLQSLGTVINLRPVACLSWHWNYAPGVCLDLLALHPNCWFSWSPIVCNSYFIAAHLLHGLVYFTKIY